MSWCQPQAVKKSFPGGRGEPEFSPDSVRICVWCKHTRAERTGHIQKRRQNTQTPRSPSKDFPTALKDYTPQRSGGPGISPSLRPFNSSIDLRRMRGRTTRRYNGAPYTQMRKRKAAQTSGAVFSTQGRLIHTSSCVCANARCTKDAFMTPLTYR